MELKGTKTEKNLLTAFAGESQARNRYDFFAAKAKSDGYVLVRDIFQETALQEKEHAKRLFKFLEGGDVEMLQDLVLTAVNEAVRIGRATMDREVSAITGGIKLPGII